VTRDAITIVISYDNSEGQQNLTPWVILHQFGEIATLGGTQNFWRPIFDEFKEYLESTPIARGQDKWVKTYGGRKLADSFTHLFKMKSAREFIHGNVGNFDMDAELVAEFLWHGSHIRMNYPDWIDNDVVNMIKDKIESKITSILDPMIGKSFNNLFSMD